MHHGISRRQKWRGPDFSAEKVKFHQSFHVTQRIELTIDEAYSDDLADPMTILAMAVYLAELMALKLAIIVRRLIISVNPCR